LIVSKPYQSTLLSFSIFLVISFALIGMSLIQILSDQEALWYAYLVLFTLTPLALFITYRTFFNYKLFEFANDKIAVKYSVRKMIKSYPLSEVLYWRESVVKTGKNSTFKELEIQFTDHFKVSLGLKEYTDYPKVFTYLEKKLGSKKQVSN